MGKKKRLQIKSALVQLAQNRSGLKGLPDWINENFQARNRWTLVQDFEESVAINFNNPNETDLEKLRIALIKALSQGQWLVLNMGFRKVDIAPFTHREYFPRELFDPISIFMDKTLDVIRENAQESFEIKDDFRVIVVSKQVEFPDNLVKHFGFVHIDEEMILDEIREAKIAAQKKANVKIQKLNEDLFEACFQGYMDKVAEYIQDGADPQYKDPYNNFPLSEASLKVRKRVIQGNYDVVEYLLTYQEPGVDPNQVNINHRSALHKAAFNGHQKIVQLLLNHGADPRLMDDEALTPLDVASTNACKTALAIFNIEDTERLIEERHEKLELREQQGVQLEEGMKRKQRERIRAFLVDCALNGKYKEIEEVVSNKQAFVDTRNQQGCSLLSLACQNNHADCVRRLLLTLGANINSRDNRGWTPLAHSAYLGRAKIVRILLERGADPNIPNNKNKFPMQMAKKEEIVEIIEKREELKNNTKFEQMLEDNPFDLITLSSSSSEEEELGNLTNMPLPGRTLYEAFYSPHKHKKKKKKNRTPAKRPPLPKPSLVSIPSVLKQNPLYGSPLFPLSPRVIPTNGFTPTRRQQALCPPPRDPTSLLEQLRRDNLRRMKRKIEKLEPLTPQHRRTVSTARPTVRVKSRGPRSQGRNMKETGGCLSTFSQFSIDQSFMRLKAETSPRTEESKTSRAPRMVKWGETVTYLEPQSPRTFRVSTAGSGTR